MSDSVAATKKRKRAVAKRGVARPDGSISLADEDAVKEVLVDSVLSLWDVVNGLTRLQPSRRDRYSVTIFGSARLKPGSFGYEETKRVSAELARMGCDIVTGGGPGLMQAANEGAASAREFRTAPLWGLRILTQFLHDGRAATIEAAIAAHDGQGRASRDRFNALNATDRNRLLAFLRSL